MIIKFDVFGKTMSIIRKDHEWQLYNESKLGIRARVYDVVIPQELGADELASYLDDIYHEYSTQTHPRVVRLGDKV